MKCLVFLSVLTSLANPPERVQFATVSVIAGPQAGSGVAIAGGRVLTCTHVLTPLRNEDGSYRAAVVTNCRGIPSEAEVLYACPRTDVAVLAPGRKDFPCLPLPLHDALPRVGDPVWVCGSPGGPDWQGTVTAGHTSFVRRLHQGVEYDQFSVSSFKGTSGGGVFDRHGRLLGIVSGGFGESYTLALPARRILALLETLP